MALHREHPASTKHGGSWALVLLAVMAAALLVTPVTPAVTARTTPSAASEQEVSGVLVLNEQLAPVDTVIALATNDGSIRECGTGTTEANGLFTISVDSACGEVEDLVARLSALPEQEPMPFAEGTGGQRLLRFSGLDDDALATLGVQAAPAPTTAEERAAQPLLQNGVLFWLLVVVIVASGAVIAYIVLRGKDRDLAVQTQAVVYVAVIIAIIILGITGKVTSEGLIAVLAAIVGWEAARPRTGRQSSTSTDGAAQHSGGEAPDGT